MRAATCFKTVRTLRNIKLEHITDVNFRKVTSLVLELEISLNGVTFDTINSMIIPLTAPIDVSVGASKTISVFHL